MIIWTKKLLQITLEIKILENDIDKENDIIDKNVNDICEDVAKINFHISKCMHSFLFNLK